MNSSDKLRLLLDSTYLLSILGVEVEGVEVVMKVLKKLYELGAVEYYYSLLSMLEILGKLSKLNYVYERVARGLRSIEETFKAVYPTAEGYMKALELRTRGFKDFIDLFLYATALTRDLFLLTRDEQLVEFLRKQNEDLSCVIYEKELVERYG